MTAIGPRRPRAGQVIPYAGGGLGLPVVTSLPTRQWRRPARRAYQVVPIDWRPDGPVLTFGSGGNGSDAGAAGACEDCEQ